MTNEPQQGASELTREEIDELVKFVEKACSHKAFNHDDGEPLLWPQRVLRGLIASTTAVAPAVAEPVAYRSRLRGHGRWVLTENAGEGHPDVECEPLYTAPPERTEPVKRDVERALDLVMSARSQDRVLLEAENYLKRALAAPPERTEPVAVIEGCGNRTGAYLTHCEVKLRVFNGYIPKTGDSFYTAQPNWREPLEALAAKMEGEFQLTQIGPESREHNHVLRFCAAQLRTTIEALAAQHGDGGTTK